MERTKCKSYIQLDQLKQLKRTNSRFKRRIPDVQGKTEKAKKCKTNFKIALASCVIYTNS